MAHPRLHFSSLKSVSAGSLFRKSKKQQTKPANVDVDADADADADVDLDADDNASTTSTSTSSSKIGGISLITPHRAKPIDPSC